MDGISRRHSIVFPFRRARLAAGLWLVGFPAFAWAQKPATIPNEDNGLVQYVVAGLIMLVISVTGFLKSGRSHKA